MKKICTALFALCVGWSHAQSLQELTTAEVFKNDKGELLYRQYLKQGETPETKIPLVLFLHGAGERGNDNAAQLKHGVGPIIQYSRRKNIPMLLLVPQCPEHMMWVNTPWGGREHRMPPTTSQIALTLDLLKQKRESLPIDPSRIYVTGISMGGYGTWDIIQREPEIFVAAIPICGGGDTTKAARIKNIPIWAFHGDADGAVPVSRSRSMVAALWACEGKIRYREYPNMNHDVWTRTYNDPMVLDWFFRQRKPQPQQPAEQQPAK
ncbi:MAG: dienelactone hydrolase family protein [Kiritimatiellae bacterium]|nr:dienelactone hydrolase family protein [Kiritimatiellia bacterium]